MLGTIVNAIAIIIGGFIGLILKKGFPQKLSDAVMSGVALCVLYIGISGCLKGQNALITVISIAVGAIIGTLLNLAGRLESLGLTVEKKFSKNRGSRVSVAEGFVSASLLFCVGAMAIMGSLQSGLTGNNETLYTKSLLDFISSIVFASSLGAGVLLSSIMVLLYQGTMTSLAGFLAPYLSDVVVAEMTCAGSILLIGLGLNMLKVTNTKVMNYVPAIFLPIILCLFM